MDTRDMPIDEHDIRTAWDAEGSLVLGHTGHGIDRVYIGQIEEVNRFLNEFPSAMPSRASKIAEFRKWYGERSC